MYAYICVCVSERERKYVTRTSSCGNGPREFSGTLIGGMTQSLFMRLSWLSMFRDGNIISFKSLDMTGGTETSWTCGKDRKEIDLVHALGSDHICVIKYDNVYF